MNYSIKNAIKEHALEEKPNECCGLIIDLSENINNTLFLDSNIVYFKCKNNSCFDKKTHFELSGLDYLRASRIGKILAIVHSQNSNCPSILDMINSKAHNIKSIIYSIDNDIFFECGESKLWKYIGLPFQIGKNDCFSLMKDYYKNELNINISNYDRDNNWYETNPKIMEDSFEKEGFIITNLNNIKKHDIILFDLLNNKHPHHIGIYLDKDNFLHHMRGSCSLIEFFNDSWKKRIEFILRHKLLN